jgi:hypothetical protein
MENVTQLGSGNGLLLLGLLELSGWEVRLEEGARPTAVATRDGVEVRVSADREIELPIVLFQRAMRTGADGDAEAA